MSFATGLEGFVMLLPWGRRDIKRGHMLDRIRWFQWGYQTHAGDYPDPTAPNGWYILIGLPSYVMMQSWYRMDEPTWHQRYLLFRGKLPSGEAGWEVTEIECERGSPSTSSQRKEKA